MNTVLREAMDTIQNQTQKLTIERSTEDTEIENLDKKRKELRKKQKQKQNQQQQQKNQQQTNNKQKNNNNKQTNKETNKTKHTHTHTHKNNQPNKQNTKRQGRICRTQQVSEKETQNKSTEERKIINTGNTGNKKRSKTDL